MLVVFALSSPETRAAAEPPSSPPLLPRQNALSPLELSVGPASYLLSGFERVAGYGRLSFAGRVGVGGIGRLEGFDFLTLAFVADARLWLSPHTLFDEYRGRAAAGPFASVRLGFDWLRIDDPAGYVVAPVFHLSAAANLGYRFSLFGRLGVTSALGGQLLQELGDVDGLATRGVPAHLLFRGRRTGLFEGAQLADGTRFGAVLSIAFDVLF